VNIEISFYKFITLLKCFKILAKIYLKVIGERDHLEDPVVDWRITLRWIFRTWDGGMECIRLTGTGAGTGGGRKLTFGFQKMQGISV
jgi:hypothetical protein